jgi:predicted Zn-dependent protease with MMP-like domain
MRAGILRRLVVAELVREAIDAQPAPVRQAFASLQIRVKEAIDDEDIGRGAAADLPGYYYAEQDESDDAGACPDRLEAPAVGGELPPQIVVIAANVEPTAEAVAKVLLHELGHHLGFSEVELVEGLGLI